ncbi:hypothetical protein [Luteibacter sahnii]|uniref:hypothetical protein n=1 Tax=Luteibacter sahnii TaxID=3021977 RepID=UPI002A6B5C5F|nr:hypothetical protein [Luteibacter sp. PPL193]MDY1549547.1 hypothetical protein [Luteibacter sp. PPL193]
MSSEQGKPMKQIILAASLAIVATQAYGQSTPAQRADRPTEVTQQTANSHPQTMKETPRSRAHEPGQHWTDGMNTKRSVDPRQRDEFGAPKVTPPAGQGTDNAGGIPTSDSPAGTRE